MKTNLLHKSRKISSHALTWIILVGFVIRLAFYFIGASIYYGGGSEFINSDTISYSRGFLNWWLHGHYTFDLNNPNASYGRVPGYSIFWGLHYLVFGPQKVYAAIGFTQLLLDTLVIFMMYHISLSLTNNIRIAILTAVIYSCYPFAIVWTTQNITESPAVFFTVSVFYAMTRSMEAIKKFIFLGVLIGIATLVRPYLGILLVSAGIYFFTQQLKSTAITRYSLLLLMGFALSFGWWPARNYIESGKIILLQSPNSGYPKYAPDFNSFQRWVFCWDTDIEKYKNLVFAGAGSDSFPAYCFSSEAERQLADKALEQLRSCSFAAPFWKHDALMYDSTFTFRQTCSDSVVKGFNQLKQSFINHHPFVSFFKVPLMNFYKAIFKNDLTIASDSWITKLLFTYRTLLQLLGWIGIILLIRNKKWWPLIFFIVFMYVYICAIFRRLQIRYILQAEVMLLIPAAVAVFVMVSWMVGRMGRQEVKNEM